MSMGKEVDLGDVVELVMGQAPPSTETNFSGNGVPFVKVGEFGSVRPMIREWTTKPLRQARRTDVLLCVVGATCGKINLGEDCAIGRSVAAIRPDPKQLDQFYLYYFMMTLIERLRSDSVGAAQTVISKEMVKSVRLPLASLSEQQRIVGVLDEAFEGIATAKANAEKNLANARAVFEARLDSAFSDGQWIRKPLSEVADFKNGLNFNQSSAGQRVEIVGVGDFQDNDVVPLSDLATITIDGSLSMDYRLREGDVVTVRSNGSKNLVGRCMLVPKLDDVLSFSGFIIRIRPNNSVLSPQFLLYFMKSGSTRARLTREGGGANISNINQGKLAALTIPVPSLAIQSETVDQLERVREETLRLEGLYERKVAALDELKQSLLREAFSGRL